MFYSVAVDLGLSNRLLPDFDAETVKRLLCMPVDYSTVKTAPATLFKRSQSFLDEQTGNR